MKMTQYYTDLINNPEKLDKLLIDRKKRIKLIKSIAILMTVLSTIIIIGNYIMNEPRDLLFFILAFIQIFVWAIFSIEYQILALIKAIHNKFELKNKS